MPPFIKLVNSTAIVVARGALPPLDDNDLFEFNENMYYVVPRTELKQAVTTFPLNKWVIERNFNAFFKLRLAKYVETIFSRVRRNYTEVW